MNRARRRLAGMLIGCVVLAGCGQPDADRSERQPPDTLSFSSAATDGSTSAESSFLQPSSDTVVTETPSPEPATTPLAEQLGVTGVVPWGPVTQDDIETAIELVATLDLAGKAGSVVMASSADAVGTTAVADLRLGGVILMGSKGAVDGTADGTPAQVAELTGTLAAQAQQPGFPLLVGTDQENGLVTRLVNGFTDLPGQDELGEISDLSVAIDATQQAAAVTGAELAAVGINVDFAPVSDVLPGSGESGMLGRSFGSDPQQVAALVSAAVAGYQSTGIAATLKHFPGIGELAVDTHTALAALTADCETWNSIPSVPLRAGVQSGVGLVMTGHALFPAVDPGSDPTSLSAVVVTELLRSDPETPVGAGCMPLGFHGVAVTDSLQMAPIVEGYSAGDAAWRALAAGQDLVLMPVSPAEAVAGIEQAVASGQLAETRLNDASVRVFALRSALSRVERPPVETVGSPEHQAIADEVWAAVG